MARKEIQRNRLADGDVMLKVQFALAAICVIIHRVPRLRYSGSPRTAVPL